MPRQYAMETEVSAAKSRAAIEDLLRQHGATEYGTAWNATHDTIHFRLRDQLIRFLLPRVDAKKHARDRRGYPRAQSTIEKAVDQADRQRWRALYLVIRAKLEAIQSGIAVYEQEFLAFIVDPVTDLTVGDILIPRLLPGRGVAGLLTAGDGVTQDGSMPERMRG